MQEGVLDEQVEREEEENALVSNHARTFLVQNQLVFLLRIEEIF